MIRVFAVALASLLPAAAAAQTVPCAKWERFLQAITPLTPAQQATAITACRDKINWAAPSRYGFTALSSVVTDANIPLLRVMLEAGLDPNMRDRSKETPLHWLGVGQNEAAALNMLDVLLAHGAQLDVVDRSGMSPFTTAVSFGRDKLVRAYLANGVDARKLDGRGRSALFETVTGNCRPAMGRLLLAQGARMSDMDTFNQQLMWDGMRLICTGTDDAEAYRRQVQKTASVTRGVMFTD